MQHDIMKLVDEIDNDIEFRVLPGIRELRNEQETHVATVRLYELTRFRKGGMNVN